MAPVGREGRREGGREGGREGWEGGREGEGGREAGREGGETWKFMVGTGHRLRCKIANLTNHKFPATGAIGKVYIALSFEHNGSNTFFNP